MYVCISKAQFFWETKKILFQQIDIEESYRRLHHLKMFISLAYFKLLLSTHSLHYLSSIFFFLAIKVVPVVVVDPIYDALYPEEEIHQLGDSSTE